MASVAKFMGQMRKVSGAVRAARHAVTFRNKLIFVPPIHFSLKNKAVRFSAGLLKILQYKEQKDVNIVLQLTFFGCLNSISRKENTLKISL